jgi:ATP-dependent Lhr-like helicase
VPRQLLAEPTDPLAELAARFARTHTLFAADQVAAWLGVKPPGLDETLRRLVQAGKLERLDDAYAGRSPCESRDSHVSGGLFCDPGVLRQLKRRSLAAARQAVEPVPQRQLASFLPQWHEFGRRRGADGLLRTVEQLSGLPLPASALETLILPARVVDYQPAMLDELLAAGEVLWQGRGSLTGNDGWIALHAADLADVASSPPAPTGQMTAPTARMRSAASAFAVSDQPGLARPTAAGDDAPPLECRPPIQPTDLADQVLGLLRDHGALFVRDIAASLGEPRSEASIAAALWELAWAGLVSNDTFAPVRALLRMGSTTHRRPSAPPARGRYGRRLPRASLRPAPQAAGRWWVLPTARAASRSSEAGGQTDDATRQAVLQAELLLDRYPVLTRGSVVAEQVEGGFARMYQVLAAAEDAGRVRRGYFVAGLGAAQFAPAEVVDRLRESAKRPAALRPPVADAAGAATWPELPVGGKPCVGGESGLATAAEPEAGDQVVAWAEQPGDSRPPGVAAEGGVQPGRPGPTWLLAASDPANPYGAALEWPASPTGHLPGRKAGALVVIDDGELILYLERGAKTVLTWDAGPARLAAASRALAAAIQGGQLDTVTIERIDGQPALGCGHPLVKALESAGFKLTPSGYKLRSPPG